jgi:hypothetical protein
MVWKRNRNLYTMLMLNQIVTFGKLDQTFVAKPPENGALLAILSKTHVNSQLSTKFKSITNNFQADKIKERLLSPDQLDGEAHQNQHQM